MNAPMISRRAKLLAGAAAGAIAVVGLSGCSQIASLKQVSGVPMTMVTIAANDILVEKKIDILTAPVCSENTEATLYTCNGKTLSGEAIVVTAPATEDSDKLVMVIKVNNVELFTGNVQEVINKSQEGAGQ